MIEHNPSHTHNEKKKNTWKITEEVEEETSFFEKDGGLRNSVRVQERDALCRDNI